MRLINISNRLPFTVTVKEGKPSFKPSSGGVATGLWSYLQSRNAAAAEPMESLWLGWCGSSIPGRHQAAVREHGRTRYQACPVFLTEQSMERFYHGFCNKTIWPLFHYFPMLTRYEEDYWAEYQRVNQVFFDSLQAILQPDDIVWVHDYQLMLLPRLIREHFPDMAIGFFLHIPFPSFEAFRLLPGAWRREILEGLLGASLIGFHTHDYLRHFLGCVLRTVGLEHKLGRIALRDRVVKVDTFPMGIEFDKFQETARSVEVERHLAGMREEFKGKKVIFSVDRLDYTKGIVNRFRGYELFLKRNPQWHGKVVFVMAIAPSRTGVETYATMKKEIDQWVGRICGAYGRIGWTPLIYQYQVLPFEQLVAMYRGCDVALVTPLRDGMNLVAKEFLACRLDQSGVLILSEMAGAAKEMGEAIIVNPFHTSEIAQALEEALAMPPGQQAVRNRVMQERLRRYNVIRWAEDFVQMLLTTQQAQAATQARSLNGRTRHSLLQNYRSASRRAILLDYDGTLVPFVNDPQQARPDDELLKILETLGTAPGNRLTLVSGRPRADLEKWLGHLPLSLMGEHGVCLRLEGGEWRQLKQLATAWKEQIRPILQLYVDRLPGASIEEKEYSLAWHYRQADPDQGTHRAKELMDDLADYTRNLDMQVLEGNKVVEVRNAGVNKGSGALEWLATSPADFVLAIGDDWTDEDLFRALPETAFTVRVGLANTAARFHLPNCQAVRRLLRELADLGRSRDA